MGYSSKPTKATSPEIFMITETKKITGNIHDRKQTSPEIIIIGNHDRKPRKSPETNITGIHDYSETKKITGNIHDYGKNPRDGRHSKNTAQHTTTQHSTNNTEHQQHTAPTQHSTNNTQTNNTASSRMGWGRRKDNSRNMITQNTKTRGSNLYRTV